MKSALLAAACAIQEMIHIRGLKVFLLHVSWRHSRIALNPLCYETCIFKKYKSLKNNIPFTFSAKLNCFEVYGHIFRKGALHCEVNKTFSATNFPAKLFLPGIIVLVHIRIAYQLHLQVFQKRMCLGVGSNSAFSKFRFAVGGGGNQNTKLMQSGNSVWRWGGGVKLESILGLQHHSILFQFQFPPKLEYCCSNPGTPDPNRRDLSKVFSSHD